jgi:hypothetical protein
LSPHLSFKHLHSPSFSFALMAPSFTMFSLHQFALALLLFPPIALADPIHLPLARRSSGNRDIDYYISAAKHLQGKYNITGKSYSPRGKRGTSASIQTINQVHPQSVATYLNKFTVFPANRFELSWIREHRDTVSPSILTR